MRRHPFVALWALALLAPATLTACSGSAGVTVGGGEPAVPEQQVEKNARKQLTQTVGQQAPAIDCPGNLTAKVGTTMTCTMEIAGKPYDVAITGHPGSGQGRAVQREGGGQAAVASAERNAPGGLAEAG